MRIEKLRTEHNVTIAWVHFPLHPETPAEGQSLEDLFRGRNVDRKAMHAQMKARMDAEGLPYGERAMTYNSRLAQELGRGRGQPPRAALRRRSPAAFGDRQPVARADRRLLRAKACWRSDARAAVVAGTRLN